MTTPRFRHWMRASGPRVISGLLIGGGIIILVVSQLLNSRLSNAGFISGMVLALAGLTGILTAKDTPLD